MAGRNGKCLVRRCLAYLLVFAMVFSSLSLGTLTETKADAMDSFASGNGTSEDPYLIETAEQLAAVFQSVENGDSLSGVVYKLTQDIDMSGYSWTSSSGEFQGILNGCFHSITISNALFYQIGTNGVVENLYVYGAVTLDEELICYENRGIIRNCIINGSVNKTLDEDIVGAGLVCNENWGTVENCGGVGSVYVSSQRVEKLGFVCDNDGYINNCYAAISFSYRPVSGSDAKVMLYPMYATNDLSVTNCLVDKTLFARPTMYNATGLTTDEMKSQVALSYLNANTSDTFWILAGDTNNGYPIVIGACEEHIPATIPAVEPSCTEVGYTEGSVCSVCGTVLVEPVEIDSLGHTPEDIKAIWPTCTQPGSTEGRYCEVCGMILTHPDEIPAKGHTPETRGAVDATDTEAGYSGDVYCSVCGELLSQGEEVPALGHEYVLVESIKEGSNNESGYTEGLGRAECSRCGEDLGLVKTRPLGDGTSEVTTLLEKLAEGKVVGSYQWTLYEGGILDIVGEGEISGPGGWNDQGYNSEIKEIYLAEGITGINSGLFSQCTNAEFISIPASLTTIGNGVFDSCYNLFDAEWTLPSQITVIGDGAFAGCVGLERVILHENLNSFGNDVFARIENGPEVFYLGGPEQWSQIAPNYTRSEEDASVIHCIRIAGGVCGDDLKWVLYEDGTLLIYGRGGMYDYSNTNFTPWYVDYVDVVERVVFMEGTTSIGNYSFYKLNNLKTIHLPESITKLGKYSFFECKNLEELYITGNVRKVGIYALDTCDSLAKVVYGGTVAQWNNNGYINYDLGVECIDGWVGIGGEYSTGIYWRYSNGTLTFSGRGEITSQGNPWDQVSDKIKTVVFEEGITSVYSYYAPANVKKIVLPSTLTSCRWSFTELKELETIEIKEGNDSFLVQDGVLFCRVNYYDAEQDTYVEYYHLVCYPANNPRKIYTVPENVRRIEDHAFSFSNHLEEIVVSEGVGYIGDSVFSNCNNLETIVFPDSVEYLGNYVLQECPNLRLVSLPQNLKKIRAGSFSECSSLESVKLPKSVKSIDTHAFYGCTSLQSLDLANVTEEIGYGAFSGCTSLSSVAMSRQLKSMGGWAFGECSALESIIIPDGIKEIKSYTFYGCHNLEHVYIPDTVVTIEENAFMNCYSLTEILIPDSVSGSIGECAFERCGSLESVIILGGKTSIGGGITTIGRSAFRECSSLKEIILPDSVTLIETNAFYDCESLKSVTLQNANVEIQNDAFGYWSGIVVNAPLTVHELRGKAQTENNRGYLYTLFCCTDGVIALSPNGEDYTEFRVEGNSLWVDGATITNEIRWPYDDRYPVELLIVDTDVSAERPLVNAHGWDNLKRVVISDHVNVSCDQVLFGGTNIESLEINGTLKTWVLADSSTKLKSWYIMKEISVDSWAYYSSVKDIYFYGTEAEWSNVLENWSQHFENAIIHYNYSFLDFGSCGENLTWRFDSEGLLEIQGSGAMDAYTENSPAPWTQYIDQIEKITIPAEVTAISEHAFDGMENVEVFYAGTEAQWSEAVGEEATLDNLIIHTECDRYDMRAHAWDEGEITDPGTCTTPGTKTHHCVSCDAVMKESIDGIEHDYQLRDSKAATCEEDGYERYVCLSCFAEKEVVLEAKGHEVIIDEAYEPTCTEEGRTEGSHCAVCEVVLVEQEIIPAMGHQEIYDYGYAATCTENGLTDGSHCAVCGETICEQEMIPALGHDVVIDEAIESTCLERGLTEGSHCGRCGEILLEQQSVAAFDHNIVIQESAKATCTEDGLTIGAYCDRCGKVIFEQRVIPAEGHNIVTDPAVAATCTMGGLIEGSHCEKCNEVFTAQEITPALGHEVVIDPSVEVTCTTAGLTEGSHCDRCGVILTAQEIIQPEGHHVVIQERVDATCEEDGLTVGSYCDVCGHVFFEQEVMPALGHEEVIRGAREATIFTDGYTGDKVCQHCGEVFEEGENILRLTWDGPAISSLEQNEDGIHVTWDEDENAEYYLIYREEGEGDWILVGQTDQIEYVDADTLTDGMEYSYGIRAYFDGLLSDPSRNVVTIVYRGETIENGVTIKGTSLTLNGDIGLNFYVNIPEAAPEDGAYALLIHNGEETKINLFDAKHDGDLYKFTMNVAAKEMQDTVTLKLYDGFGHEMTMVKGEQTYSDGYSYSVMDYIDLAMESDNVSAEMKILMRNMKNYGGYAQKYFEYNAEDAETDAEAISEVNRGNFEDYKSGYSGDVEGITYYGSSLLLENMTTIRHYFKLEGETEQYTVTVDGKETVLQQKGNLYYIEIRNIAAQDLSYMFNVTIRDKESGKSANLRYGAFSYADNVLERSSNNAMEELVKAMYLYCRSAQGYFAE